MDKFPRAQFGLPIIFQFKDDDDPSNTTLQGAHHDRLASPLILRPIVCKQGAVGLAVALDAPTKPPGGWVLKDAPGNPAVSARVSKGEALSIPPLDGEPDVLKAFLDYLE